jgi:hypothetical protein
MGDKIGHEFRGNQWTVGGGGVRVDPTRQDKMSLEEMRSGMRDRVKQFREDPDYRGAAVVVSEYARATQNEGLATRAIVERALKGKTAEQILADPKVQKLIGNINQYRNEHSQVDAAELVKTLVGAAPGYYATVRDAQPTVDTVYRGAARLPKGVIERSEGPLGDARFSSGPVKEFELQGPTAFTHDRDVALTYSGGILLEVVPGAKMLPVHEMSTARSAAESGGDAEKYATLPAFYHRSDRAIHPLGPGYGGAIDYDTDRELSTAGRFKVLEVVEKRIPFRDAKSGKERVKSVKIVKIQHVGVF